MTPSASIPTPVQDPEYNNFFARLSKKNTDVVAHKNTVDSYQKYWEADHKNLRDTENTVADRRENSATLTNHYYDLVTDFYEYGWGMSFHFARMFRNSTFNHCISVHENYLALKLNLKPDMHCLDVGCGVGGPLREIIKFSGAHVTGINNNAYQVKRCHYLAEMAGLSKYANAVKGDFENMPFPDNTFDSTYAIEATCHARHLENPYGEIYRTLKPGSYFACYEWLTTDCYDENNLEQKKIIHGIEEGNSISKLYTIPECINAIKSCGFELIEYRDLADPNAPMAQAQDPWYKPLQGSYSFNFDDIHNWRMNPIGRFVTDKFVFALETLRLAPSGTRQVSKILNNAADCLIKGGEQHLFTPMFFFLARKPLSTSEE